MFRDEKEASHAQETSELRNKLHAEKERAEKLQKEIDALRPKVAPVSKPIPSVSPLDFTGNHVKPYINHKPAASKPSWDTQFPSSSRSNYDMSNYDWAKPRFPSRATNVKIGLFFIAALFVGVLIHHEFYDPRDGYVTDKTYAPGYWTTTTNSNGTTTTSYTPPSWSVSINFRGNSAVWDVSEETYEGIDYGDWYCARDLLHEAPCIRDEPANF